VKKKVLLCILDGFGLGDEKYEYNAVFRSNIPNLKRFLKDYPYSFLQTSGIEVGLPEGQMGNSEVGHMTIGSGRILIQDLPRITNAIEKTKEIWEKEEIKNALSLLKKTGKALHVLGLCSDGGVHSSISHIVSIANYFAKNGVKVYLHALSDGRDVPIDSFLKNLPFLERSLDKNVILATICGRYFTMDRDGKTDRTIKGTNAVLYGKGTPFEKAEIAIKASYKNGKSDEFIEPIILNEYKGASDGDILFFANFRADRARQATSQFIEEGIFQKIITMMPYSEELEKSTVSLFKKDDIVNTLSQIVSNSGLKQLKIAETEKYAHVTFFFNGGKEEVLIGETRIIIPSPNVKTYDLKPEMSLPLLEQKLLDVIKSQENDLIVCNIANGDMVGHTGDFEAAKKAMERIDEFLGKIEVSCLLNGYTLLITADHGNLEEMKSTNGEIHTQHTTGQVPIFLISEGKDKISFKNGSLINVAPTILKIMGLPIPHEMTSEPLF
jgi:2,3-bisphosphoglycerate-independent phosphoglycerate mutase